MKAPPSPECSVDFGNGTEEGAPADGHSMVQQEPPAPSQGDSEEEQPVEVTEQEEADAAGPPSALLVRQEGEICSIVTFGTDAADQELLDLFKFRKQLVEQNKDVTRKHGGRLSYSIAASGMR